MRNLGRVKKCDTCAHDSRRFSGVLTYRKCARSVHCASTAVRMMPIPIGREEETSPDGACIDLDSHQLLVDLLSSYIQCAAVSKSHKCNCPKNRDTVKPSALPVIKMHYFSRIPSGDICGARISQFVGVVAHGGEQHVCCTCGPVTQTRRERPCLSGLDFQHPRVGPALSAPATPHRPCSTTAQVAMGPTRDCDHFVGRVGNPSYGCHEGRGRLCTGGGDSVLIVLVESLPCPECIRW